MRLKDLWALQLQKLPELVALVEQADEQANSSKFADALMQLLSSVVLSTRAKSYIAGLELLAVPALTNNEAIVVSAIALVSRKAVSSQTGGSVLIAVNEAMQAVVTAQPTEAVLAKLIEQVRWSRSATARYAALATLGLGFEAFVLAAETLPVVEGFGDALLELVITNGATFPKPSLSALLCSRASPTRTRSLCGASQGTSGCAPTPSSRQSLRPSSATPRQPESPAAAVARLAAAPRCGSFPSLR